MIKLNQRIVGIKCVLKTVDEVKVYLTMIIRKWKNVNNANTNCSKLRISFDAANGKRCRAPGAVWRLNSILASSAGLLQQAYEYHFVPSRYRSVITLQMQVRAWNINLDSFISAGNIIISAQHSIFNKFTSAAS